MSRTQELWAVELNVAFEAGGRNCDENGEYWVIHSEDDDGGYSHLFVFGSEEEAQEEAQGRDHDSRVVRFVRARTMSQILRSYRKKLLRLVHEITGEWGE